MGFGYQWFAQQTADTNVMLSELPSMEHLAKPDALARPVAQTPGMDAFHAQLRTCGAYRTAGTLPCWPRGVRASAHFHLNMMKIVVHGARLARRNAFDRRAWAGQGYAAQRLVEQMGGQVRYEGFAPAAAVSGPMVWVANHMSMLETFVLPSALLTFGDLGVVVKRSLTHYPLFGPTLRAIDPIAVSRSNPRADLKQVLQEGLAMLRQGRSVLLFPQATRMRKLDTRLFNSMGVKLAQRANVPVVPVALCTDFSTPGRWIRELGPVYPDLPVRFAASAPIGPDLHPRAWQQQIVSAIAEKLLAWGYPVTQPEGLP